MRHLVFILSFFMCFPLFVNAQENVSTDNDTTSLSPDVLATIKEKWLEHNHREQVTSIANIDFGTSREKAEKMLRKKYGTPS